MTAQQFNKNIVVESVGFEPKISKQFKEQYPHYSLPLLEISEGQFVTGVHSILLYLSDGLDTHDWNQKVKKNLYRPKLFNSFKRSRNK
jgi:hypothetical protein